MDERSLLRLPVLRATVVAALVVLLARLWFLQVGGGEGFAAAAQANTVRDVPVPAARGQVLDVLGRPLARDALSLVVTVDRTALDALPDDGDAGLARLAALLGTSVEDLRARTTPCGEAAPAPCWEGSPYVPVPVATGVTSELALTVAERAEDYPGVAVALEPVREHPQGAAAGHVVGYLAPATPDQVSAGADPRSLTGAAGVEAVYDAALRGTDGVRRLSVDTAGRVQSEAQPVAPEPGDSLVLSLDLGVQAAAEQALADGITAARARTGSDGRRLRASGGAVVVLEARTGRVVALANSPSYDPSVWNGGISSADYAALTDDDAGTPLVPRAWQGQYAPASTFKVASTLAALADGASPRARYDCPGSLRVGDRAFRNYRSVDLGRLTLHDALVKSCDTIFYRFAYDAWRRDGGLRPAQDVQPRETLAATARELGLGSPTGIDLPSEADGRVPDRQLFARRWEQMSSTWCAAARDGYPDVRASDPRRAAYLTRVARENCEDGALLRAGDAANAAIGQGETLVTPLQLAVAYAAVANGGTVWEPRLAKALVAADGAVRRVVEPVPAGRLSAPPEDLALVADALADVPVRGTAAGAFADFPLDRLPVAGKTGTGEVAGSQDTAWFASWAPADDPQYVVVVTVAQGGTGGSTAAPVAAQVHRALFGLGRPQVAACGASREVALPTIAADGSVVPPCDVPAGTPPVDAPPPVDGPPVDAAPPVEAAPPVDAPPVGAAAARPGDDR